MVYNGILVISPGMMGDWFAAIQLLLLSWPGAWAVDAATVMGSSMGCFAADLIREGWTYVVYIILLLCIGGMGDGCCCEYKRNMCGCYMLTPATVHTWYDGCCWTFSLSLLLFVSSSIWIMQLLLLLWAVADAAVMGGTNYCVNKRKICRCYVWCIWEAAKVLILRFTTGMRTAAELLMNYCCCSWVVSYGSYGSTDIMKYHCCTGVLRKGECCCWILNYKYCFCCDSNLANDVEEVKLVTIMDWDWQVFLGLLIVALRLVVLLLVSAIDDGWWGFVVFEVASDVGCCF